MAMQDTPPSDPQHPVEHAAGRVTEEWLDRAIQGIEDDPEGVDLEEYQVLYELRYLRREGAQRLAEIAADIGSRLAYPVKESAARAVERWRTETNRGGK